MPRADKQSGVTQFYHSQFSNGHPNNVQYVSESPDSPTQSSHSPTSQHSQATAPPQKKKHICSTCDRAFTTSGHLARHSRVHTGERNHKCPFPGCETRCSRQDNLQQHYRIHLSPGSRRNSTRSAIARAMNGSAQPSKRSSTASSSVEPPSTAPSLSSPPSLETARVYNHSSPPDSPPPLAHATLPATAHLPDGGSRRSSSSPEASYSPISPHHIPQVVPMTVNGHHSQPYSYRSGTTTYQEQSQGATGGFTYVHTTPISHPSTSSNGHHSGPFYSHSHSYDNHSIPHINTSSVQQHSHDNSPSPVSSLSMSSRHSISHISHPQSYPQNHSSSTGPPSPASSHSVSSHTSGPPTPSYGGFHDDAHAYHHGNAMLPEQPGISGGHLNSQSHIIHPAYSPTMNVQNNGLSSRFDSPPPVLAPIHDRRDDRHSNVHSHSHASSYIHHPQPLPTEYQYHQSIGLSHGAWKSDNVLNRKGVGALVQ